MRSRGAIAVWCACAAAGFVALHAAHPWDEQLGSFLLAWTLAWVACAGIARTRIGLPLLLLGAIAWRALLVGLDPTLSDDIHRYIWEGRIQWQGWNPFVQAPVSPALQALRDDLWASINHPTATAIYPPLAQIVFKGLAAFGGIIAFKLAFCAVDVVVVLVLARGLRRQGAGVGVLAWYAWNPLVVVEVAGSGHFEPLALLPLVAGIFWLRRRPTPAWCAVAASIGIKYAAVLLVPSLWRTRRLTARAALGAATLWCAVALPYRDAGTALFDSLWLYVDTWRYNDMLFGLLAGLVGSLTVAKMIAAVLLGIVVAVVARSSLRLETQCLVVLACLLLLSPTLHPWYLLWIAVLLPWSPSRALFAWTGSVALSYVFLYPLAGRGVAEASSVWVRLVQMLPVVAGAALDLRAQRRAQPHEPVPRQTQDPPRPAPAPVPAAAARPAGTGVVLVMPALDEEASLPLVLEDLRRLQTSHPVLDEIVVVDNGCRDRTPQIARQAGVTLLEEPQRGYGAACQRALAYLRERPPHIVVFMDADRSDDASEIPDLLRPLQQEGMDLVIGSRTRGAAEPGALLPQARFGNALATRLIHWRTGFRFTDLGPFRAIRWRALERLRLTDRDYGWTVEMQMRAVQEHLRIREVPVRYRRRVGRSKISGTLSGSWRAGHRILSTLWRLRNGVAAVLLALAAVALPARAGGWDSSPWDRQLGRWVDADGRVAYADWFQQDEDSLRSTLRALGDADPAGWSHDERLAFWINAYNAGTVWAVFQGRSAESILGRVKLFRFWSFRVAGEDRSLDDIEHEILRRRFEEPRIHFAIVCASTSCPPLRNEAYVAARLDAQLDDQARRFLNDPRRNHFDRTQGIVRLSKIFDWFEEDFERQGGLLEMIAPWVDDAATRAWLRSGAEGAEHGHLPYDWTLNAQPGQRPR